MEPRKRDRENGGNLTTHRLHSSQLNTPRERKRKRKREREREKREKHPV